VATIGPNPGDIAAKKMTSCANALKDTRTLLRPAAAIAVKRIEAQRDLATGGDGRLSGVGKSGARLGVRSKPEGTAANGRFFISATGPWQIIENDTGGRVIRSRYARGRRRKGFIGPVAAGQFKGGDRAVLNIPGVGFRRSARHPGTKGKKPWARGVASAKPYVTREVENRTVTAIRKAFQS
jgi:hypothetical protein